VVEEQAAPFEDADAEITAERAIYNKIREIAKKSHSSFVKLAIKAQIGQLWSQGNANWLSLKH